MGSHPSTRARPAGVRVVYTSAIPCERRSKGRSLELRSSILDTPKIWSELDLKPHVQGVRLNHTILLGRRAPLL